MERVVRPGEFYRHFKNKLYQIITVAKHSETGERLVVYQALYGDFCTYARPLSMFLSEVDRKKYPECGQQFRFEKTALTAEPAAEPEEMSANRHLLRFLEAESVQAQLELLKSMPGHVGTSEVESMCHVLEIPVRPGTIEEQLEEMRKALETKQRYDGRRLRG